MQDEVDSSRIHAALLEEVRQEELRAGESLEQVSFPAPPALVEAARRQTGVASTADLGLLALALLARPDPVAAILKRRRGELGRDHRLDV